MQLDTNVLQSKPPSLEEGPVIHRGYNESSAFNQVGKSNNCQRCMDIIKVILYLELILFLGWIGGIFMTNYHFGHPYTDDSMSQDHLEFINDFNIRDDSLDNTDSIPKDVIVTWIKEINDYVSTERTETSTEPIIDFTNDFFEVETTSTSNNIQTEEDEYDVIAKILNDLARKEDSAEDKHDSDKSTTDWSKKNIEINDELQQPISTIPITDLIHVRDYNYAQYYDDYDTEDKASFPIPFWLQDPKTIDLVTPEVEDDSSNIKSETLSTEKATLPTWSTDDATVQLIPHLWHRYLQKYNHSDEIGDASKNTQPENGRPELSTVDSVGPLIIRLRDDPLVNIQMDQSFFENDSSTESSSSQE